MTLYLTPHWLWLREAGSSILRFGGAQGLVDIHEGDATVSTLQGRWFYLREGDSAILRLRQWVYLREGAAWVFRLGRWTLMGDGRRVRLGRCRAGV